MTDSSRTKNRLIHETSPYLLQHAGNPVDWYPWGDEAFAKATGEKKPIFLSIGYSACHWCHVMEHESFENEEIARLLNKHFVSIKVDREERPDVDAIYMNAVMAMTGHGGWPMSVFLTADKRPFFGGTYWPPRSMRGMPGFIDILAHVHNAWLERQADVERAASEMVRAIQAMGEPGGEPQTLGPEVLKSAGTQLLRAADRQHGGFGRAPKFPHAMDLRVLLRTWRRFATSDALDVVVLTLDKMARGGIYDQLGGGFHRYSTDAVWLAPHFEKMLYDQALLVPAYIEAFQATGRTDFAAVVRETLTYVSREMTSPAGGFYSTQDADSEGEEGKFFVWTKSEVEKLLSPAEAQAFMAEYDVSEQGNWEGHNILNRSKPNSSKNDDKNGELLSSARAKLFDARHHRIAPARDEKLIASWNGMMIAAFAQAGAVLDEPEFIERATAAANNAMSLLRDEAGLLLHTAKDGVAKLNAYLDDYAALADGLTELYQSTGDVTWLEEGLKLVEQMIERFADPQGGFFYTASDHEELIVRQRDSQDNATPSGNSLAATVLLKLARLTGRSELEDRAIATLDAMSSQIAESPLASGQALIALDFLMGPTREIVLTGPAEQVAPLKRAVYRVFAPNKVVLTRAFMQPNSELPDSLRSLLVGKESGDSAAVYICEHGTCHAPLSNPEQILSVLEA